VDKIQVAGIRIAAAGMADWPEIREIYVRGIRSGHATFGREDDVPDATTWFASKLPGLVFKAVTSAGSMLGWSALAPVSTRRAYSGVAEVSVYVRPEAQGKGAGTALLSHLVAAAEAAGIWTLQASIFPENEASIRLHRRCGFRVVGMRERIGQHHGVWRDTILMERRAATP
jgi:L-amino acid N-acyltransferase YncA